MQSTCRMFVYESDCLFWRDYKVLHRMRDDINKSTHAKGPENVCIGKCVSFLTVHAKVSIAYMVT